TDQQGGGDWSAKQPQQMNPGETCHQLLNQRAHRFESVSVASGLGSAEGESVGLDGVPVGQDQAVAGSRTVSTVVIGNRPRCGDGRLFYASLRSASAGRPTRPDKVQRLSISDCCFLPIGSQQRRLLALAGDDGSVAAVTNPLAGERHCSLRTEHDSGVACLTPVGNSTTTDECRFVSISGGSDRQVKLWQVESDGGLVSLNTWTAGGSASPLVSAAGSTKSDRLATCSADGRVRVWDLRQRLVAASGVVASAACFPGNDGCYARCLDWLDDCRLVTGGIDGRLRLHDLRGQSSSAAEVQLGRVASSRLTRVRCSGGGEARQPVAAASTSDGGVYVVDFLESAPMIVSLPKPDRFSIASMAEFGDEVVGGLAWTGGQSLAISRGRSLVLACCQADDGKMWPTVPLTRYLALPQPADKVQCMYIWIDGSGENLRAKSRTVDFTPKSPKELPIWNFDGSSTGQAEGHNSDVMIHPVCPVQRSIQRRQQQAGTVCETYSHDGTVHRTNKRHSCNEVMQKVKDQHPWFGIEQEYTLQDTDLHPFGWRRTASRDRRVRTTPGSEPTKSTAETEDRRRENAEVMPAQWEFQVGPCEGIDMGDHLWLARFLLHRVAEDFGISASIPKPMPGDWNGAGAHTNYSTGAMRQPGGMKVMIEAIEKLGKRHASHIRAYDPHGGADNKRRGTSRLSSIRIPRQCSDEGCAAT
uniref:Glutamine synthetase n=1 Tax=Macrostomum lignano TaxID=282301 RepID=A0A1I8F3A4_9PLAT